MALKFKLQGLAETFLDIIVCPACETVGQDEDNFSTELTKVSLDGIIVVAQCRSCGEIFLPRTQRYGVIDSKALRDAVEKDSLETGEPLLENYEEVMINAERLNAQRKGEFH